MRQRMPANVPLFMGVLFLQANQEHSKSLHANELAVHAVALLAGLLRVQAPLMAAFLGKTGRAIRFSPYCNLARCAVCHRTCQGR